MCKRMNGCPSDTNTRHTYRSVGSRPCLHPCVNIQVHVYWLHREEWVGRTDIHLNTRFSRGSLHTWTRFRLRTNGRGQDWCITKEYRSSRVSIQVRVPEVTSDRFGTPDLNSKEDEPWKGSEREVRERQWNLKSFRVAQLRKVYGVFSTPSSLRLSVSVGIWVETPGTEGVVRFSSSLRYGLGHTKIF